MYYLPNNIFNCAQEINDIPIADKIIHDSCLYVGTFC